MRFAPVLIVLVGSSAAVEAQRLSEAPAIDLASIKSDVYKSVDGMDLRIYEFEPVNRVEGKDRPAIVFFFGGGWQVGSPTQFVPHCQYLASRGMIAFAADYRVGSRHQAKVFDCIADAKSAIRWVRSHAEKFHIDRARIVAAGGSAGGHLAACTALIDEFEEASEDKGVSSHPNAMVLFNPAVMLAPGDTIDEDSLQRTLRPFERRFGVEPTRISPFHHVKKGICPTLILHGKNDRIVPYQTVELFEQAMTKDGNDCRLVGYEGQSHGFFNKRGNNDKYFHATLRELDEFLTSIKFLEGEPTIGQP